jgi:hypothetical protein
MGPAISANVPGIASGPRLKQALIRPLRGRSARRIMVTRYE